MLIVQIGILKITKGDQPFVPLPKYQGSRQFTPSTPYDSLKSAPVNHSCTNRTMNNNEIPAVRVPEQIGVVGLTKWERTSNPATRSDQLFMLLEAFVDALDEEVVSHTQFSKSQRHRFRGVMKVVGADGRDWRSLCVASSRMRE